MTPDEWEKVSEIFHSALELPSAERPEYLDRVCAGDATLRGEVESLLAANGEVNDFIAVPASPLDVSEMPSLTGAYFGHYRIEGSIGRGGMGEVYLATDTRLSRRVALKKLPDRFTADPVFVRRFENEARAAATLNHPNIATIYTVEEFEGKPFITMEYVEGKTLDALVPAGGLDVPTFLDWFIPISEALRHAHERDVTHRDIKPGNIMISNDGVPKILDFGLAQINSAGPPDDAMTDPGQIVGTPSYMSPEQAEGKETDRCTDIFSLGVVMYEALTAKRPFGGETNAQVITNLINCEPEKISAVRGDLPRLISRLIMRCLAKRPRDRVRSMHEVSTILTEAKALRMIGPATESFGRRLYRETVHVSHYRSVGAATAIVLSAVGLWYYFASSGRTPVTLEKMTMRRLTQSNNVASVAVTPDGKSIVYVTYDKGGRRSMWLRRVDDANPIQLLLPQSSVQFWARPVISDDGGQIYYLTAGNAAAQGSIYRISALGGPPRKLVDGVNFIGSVSRDGQKILYVRLGSPTQILSANAADGGNETALLTSPNADISYKEPHVSADGKVIFYVKNERIDGVNNWSLNSMPAGGGDSTEIFRQKEDLGEICPLPNSAAVLVTSNDPATNLKQIFYVSLVDGKRVKLTNDLNYYRGLSIDNSGNIATTQLTDAARVLVGPADDLESLTPLTNQTNACCVVDWAPDGRVVFDAYENNKAHIWISDADGKTTQLTASDSEDTDPHVSGDGRFVVFTSNRSGPNQIWRMNVDGSNPVLLANVAGYTQKPQFAADGRTVMFYWNDAGRERIGKVPVEGGSVETMTELPGGYTYYWAASPDGRLIAHTYREPGGTRSKVAVRPVDSETPLIVLDIWPTSFLKWAPDSKSLFYRERETTPGYENKVLQIDLVRRVPKAVLDSDPDGVHDLAFSRDGKRAAIVRGRALADAVLISGYAGN